MDINNKKDALFNRLTQIFLPTLTILGFVFTSFKRPDIGLIFSFASQVFWLYSGWQAWRKANQIGIFISSSIITFFLIYGLINYWFFK
jgi:hypothetical protein